MTRRQKYSLGMWIIILIAIFLSVMARAQTYKLESVSGSGYKKYTSLKYSYIKIEGNQIFINTPLEKTVFNIRKEFKIKGVRYFELETSFIRAFIWINEYQSLGVRYGNITLSKRFQSEPEQKTVYRFKQKS